MHQITYKVRELESLIIRTFQQVKHQVNDDLTHFTHSCSSTRSQCTQKPTNIILGGALEALPNLFMAADLARIIDVMHLLTWLSRF